jgi:hypothetical protein
VLLALLGTAFAGGPCDLAKSATIRTTLDGMDAAQRLDLAAAWLSEACKLPSALDETLGSLSSHPPDQRSIVAMQTVAADPVLLVASCAGGPRVFASVISVAPAEKRGLLFDGCELGRHTAIDRATFVAATAGEPMLYVLAAQAVTDVIADPGVREALRALAGVPPPR